MVETVMAELIAIEKKYPHAPKSLRKKIVIERLPSLDKDGISEIFDEYYALRFFGIDTGR